MVEFGILGPAQVRLDDGLVTIRPAKQRALLASLLLRANQVTSVAAIVTALWDDDPPATATALVQTYVSALRRLLHRPGQPELIVTQPPGYLIKVQREEFDLHRFTDHLARGRASVAAGDLADASAAFDAALSLWRGHALEDVDSFELRAAAARLNQMRMVALEERIEAELRLGRHGPLVAELTELVATHRLNERLRGQLMRALYGIGRQAEALEIYRQGREILRDELGLDPSPELRAIHWQVLSDTAAPQRQPQAPGQPVPSPAAPVPSAPGQPVPSSAAPVPSQLPPAINDLTGRTEQIGTLTEALRMAGDGRHAVVCTVSGKAGSGKTTLAVYVGHLLRAAFPDGQLFVSLHGTDPGISVQPGEVLGMMLRALGTDPWRVPETPGERSALLRSMLVGRRVLMVFDDVASEAQVRPLLPASPACAALLTGRTALVGLSPQVAVDLTELTVAEATELLSRVAGGERVAADPGAARDLAQLCGCLPLAVRTAAARLSSRQDWPLSVLVERLRDEHRRLDELTAGDLAVRASVELSYRGVPELDRIAFRRLGALGAPDFSPGLLVPLLQVSTPEAERLADRLADAQLLDLAGLGADGKVRYRMHVLIRLYARERHAAEESADDARESVRRLLRRLIDVVEAIWAHSPGKGVRQRTPTGRMPRLDPAATAFLPRSAEAWLDAERWTLVTAVERASEMGLHEEASELAVLLLSSMRVHNGFDEWWRMHDTALAAVRAAGNRHGEAALLVGIGQLRYEEDRLDEAGNYYRQALAIAQQVGDRPCEVACRVGLAEVLSEQGHFAEAMQLCRLAVVACQESDDLAYLASAYYRVGYLHREVGEFDEALAACQEAVDLYRQTGNRRGEGLALRSAGLVHRATGRLAYAEELFTQAIAAFDEVGDRLLRAFGLQALAKTYVRQGRAEQARGPLLESLQACRDMCDDFGMALVQRTLGEAHLAMGDVDAAIGLLEDSVRRWEELRLPVFAARTQRDLADAHERRGNTSAARALRAEAIATFAHFGAREHGELRARYGDVLT